MTVSLTLLLTCGVLIACGIYLMLERTLSRIILGFVLAGNGVNLLFVVAAGPPGVPPFEGTAAPEEMTDPLPLAMVLTAIVITLGITAFGMALAYRAWQLFGHDEVPDDVEDRRVLRRSRRRPGAEAPSWKRPLTEEARRGALLHSQGVAPQDPEDALEAVEDLGSDLTGAEDVPQDHTEADEGESRRPPTPRENPSAAESPSAAETSAAPEPSAAHPHQHHHEADHHHTPGAGPATDADHDAREEDHA